MALSPQEIAQFHGLLNSAQPTAPKVAPKKGNFISHLLPSATSIGGGAAGAAIGTALLPGVGTLAGALLGGALGGGGGKVAENAIEHNALGDGVLKEAAIDGVLSAGPLRLGKLAGDTVKGVRAGVGAADAVKAAGVGAQDMSLLRGLGDRVGGTSDKLAIKSFRLSPSQLSKFKSAHNEDAVSLIKRYGLIGKNADQITNDVIQPLQQSFTQGVADIPTISKQSIVDALNARAAKLLESHASDTQAIGRQLQTEAKGISRKLGDSVSGTELNGVKNQFDNLVSPANRLANPAKYDVNKHVADTLRGVIHDAADTAGVSVNGSTLRNIGQELSKLRDLNQSIAKQSEVGRGSLPISLPTSLGSIGGTVAGGPLGGIASAAGVHMVNSATGRKVAANATDKISERLITKGDKSAANALGIKGITKRVAPVGLARAVGSELQSENSANSPMTIPSAAQPSIVNMSGVYQDGGDLSTPGQPGMTKDMLANAIVTDLASTGGKNIDKIKTVYALLGPQDSAKASAGYSKPTASQYSQGVTGMQAIDSLEKLVSSNPSLVSRNAAPGQNIPGVGGLVSHAAGTSQYRAISNNILNSIARINTGANMPESEAGFYSRTYLPQPGDDPQTIAAKINSLRQFFDPIVNYKSDSAGSDATDLASALSGL